MATPSVFSEDDATMTPTTTLSEVDASETAWSIADLRDIVVDLKHAKSKSSICKRLCRPSALQLLHAALRNTTDNTQALKSTMATKAEFDTCATQCRDGFERVDDEIAANQKDITSVREAVETAEVQRSDGIAGLEHKLLLLDSNHKSTEETERVAKSHNLFVEQQHTKNMKIQNKVNDLSSQAASNASDVKGLTEGMKAYVVKEETSLLRDETTCLKAEMKALVVSTDSLKAELAEALQKEMKELSAKVNFMHLAQQLAKRTQSDPIDALEKKMVESDEAKTVSQEGDAASRKHMLPLHFCDETREQTDKARKDINKLRERINRNGLLYFD